MRVLIVKTSSMGDVIHALPALTDVTRAFPEVIFDWVVEEGFAEIPRWHSHVNEVIPIAFRRWRKNIFSTKTRSEWKAFIQKLREKKYDYILDAQGLLKSAWVATLAKGKRYGLNWQSAREPLASLFYQKKYSVEKGEHAVTRLRRLFSQVFNYEFQNTVPEYGIDKNQLIESTAEKYLVLHGTTWDTKHWPEQYWVELAQLAHESGWKIKLPWGNAVEEKRAQTIANGLSQVEVLPKLNLKSVASILAGAKAIVAVDTGLGHLAAALDVPTISLYGPTNPVLTGALGQSQIHLTVDYSCSPCLRKKCLYSDDLPLNQLQTPCFATLSPKMIWAKLRELISH